MDLSVFCTGGSFSYDAPQPHGQTVFFSMSAPADGWDPHGHNHVPANFVGMAGHNINNVALGSPGGNNSNNGGTLNLQSNQQQQQQQQPMSAIVANSASGHQQQQQQYAAVSMWPSMQAVQDSRLSPAHQDMSTSASLPQAHHSVVLSNMAPYPHNNNSPANSLPGTPHYDTSESAEVLSEEYESSPHRSETWSPLTPPPTCM